MKYEAKKKTLFTSLDLNPLEKLDYLKNSIGKREQKKNIGK